LGIGTWAWGDQSVWGYNTYDSNLTQNHLESAYKKCLELGLDFFDTAESYGSGLSEQFLGTFMKNSPSKKPIIATKFLPLPKRIFASTFPEALDGSLKRLQLDSVDLYQVHGPGVSTRSVEVWAHQMGEAAKKNKIKAVGVSNYTASQMKRTQAILNQYGISLATNQVEYSLLRNDPETNGVLAACKELGVTLLAYSPLAMGRLTGKYNSTNLPKGRRTFAQHSMAEIEPIVEKLREIGKKHDKTPSQVALNWVICKGAIPLCGVKNEKTS